MLRLGVVANYVSRTKDCSTWKMSGFLRLQDFTHSREQLECTKNISTCVISVNRMQKVIFSGTQCRVVRWKLSDVSKLRKKLCSKVLKTEAICSSETSERKIIARDYSGRKQNERSPPSFLIKNNFFRIVHCLNWKIKNSKQNSECRFCCT
jgi:hypothetical protein